MLKSCPRCSNSEISKTANFCKICGLNLKSAAAAGTTAQHTCCLCEEENGDLELEDGSFICYTCAQIQSELGHERDIED